MPAKSAFYLGTIAALLTSVYLWYSLSLEPNNFIISSDGDLSGQLHFMTSATSSEGFEHIPSPPFIHVSALDEDEFWNAHPTVRSPEGKCLPEMDFSTDENYFGSLYQNVCYDSLHLTFESCFGDQVEVIEKTLPRGKIRLATERLDASVGYIRGPVPKATDFSSIMIVLRTYGCFSSREETLSVLKQPDGTALVHYVLPRNKVVEKIFLQQKRQNSLARL